MNRKRHRRAAHRVLPFDRKSRNLCTYQGARSVGKKLTRRLIIKDFKRKTTKIVSMMQKKTTHEEDKNNSRLLLSSLDQSNPNYSTDVAPGSMLDEIPTDKYYAEKTLAPLFSRPVWRRRRPMIAQSIFRQRPELPSKKQDKFIPNIKKIRHVYW